MKSKIFHYTVGRCLNLGGGGLKVFIWRFVIYVTNFAIWLSNQSSGPDLPIGLRGYSLEAHNLNGPCRSSHYSLINRILCAQKIRVC